MALRAFLGSCVYFLNLRYQTFSMGFGTSKSIVKLQT